MINLIDGKKLSEELLKNCKNEVEKIGKNKRKPTLVVITVGDDMASKIYVRNKAKACENCGILFKNERFEANVTRDVIKNRIKELNEDKSVDGIFVQLPVPKTLEGIEQEISHKKDVDGFSLHNLGRTLYNVYNTQEKIEPCTPHGIMYMLDKYKINLQGKHVVILGRSNIVGKPLIGMLLNKNATVTSCNSYTENTREITKTADILICAIGKSKYINSTYITDKTDVIIDVGINRQEDKRICGDVDFEDIIRFWTNTSKDKYITPVPGGVGPMTVASLINNVIKCYKNSIL